MKLKEALQIIREVNGKGYTYLQNWGLSTTRLAVRIVLNRKSASIEDKQIADGIKIKIYRKW